MSISKDRTVDSDEIKAQTEMVRQRERRRMVGIVKKVRISHIKVGLEFVILIMKNDIFDTKNFRRFYG